MSEIVVEEGDYYGLVAERNQLARLVAERDHEIANLRADLTDLAAQLGDSDGALRTLAEYESELWGD